MKKFNWGHGITAVIILFLIGMISMVYIASRQTNEMIDQNYYAQELQYQHTINAANNLRQHTNTDHILAITPDGITLQLPPQLCTNIKKGNIELLKPDDSHKDEHYPLQPDSTGKQTIKDPKLTAGFYVARIYWENENTPYYHEQKIYYTTP